VRFGDVALKKEKKPSYCLAFLAFVNAVGEVAFVDADFSVDKCVVAITSICQRIDEGIVVAAINAVIADKYYSVVVQRIIFFAFKHVA
jgi:hypothetical protein